MDDITSGTFFHFLSAGVQILMLEIKRNSAAIS
jgi:hypothetical protein